MASDRKIVTLLAAVAVVALVLVAVLSAQLLGGEDDGRPGAADDTSAPTPMASPTAASSTPMEVETRILTPEPASFVVEQSSCEDEWPVVLQPQPDGTTKLVAEALVTNEGELPGKVAVTARWLYFGGGSTEETKTVRVKPGASVRVPLSKVVPQSEGLRMVGHQHGDRMCRVSLN